MWDSIKKFFKHSETIFWARATAFIGLCATVITYVDPVLIQDFLTPQTFSIYVLLNGLATEYLRRRREEDM